MAISTYGELKSAVAEWLAKSNLSSRAADFITLASTRIYYGAEGSFPSEPVRTFELQAQNTPTPSSRVITLPTRYIETIRLKATDGSQSWTLDYVSPAAMSEYDDNEWYAQYYTLVNGGILLGGSQQATYTHDYYAALAEFSGDSDTNALLTKAPGLWLYGASLEAAVYQRDDATAQRMLSLYNGVAAALNNQLKRAGGGTLAMRKR